MRLTLTYDIHGNIATICASPPKSAVMHLEVKPGYLTTEVDMPDVASDRIKESLADLIQNHRVDSGSSGCRLTKKTAKKPSK